MNDILNISSKNSYLTTRQWKEIKEYVKNRKNITENTTIKETDDIIEEEIQVKQSEAYEQMIVATSVSDMYMILLSIMNENPEKLYEISSDELQILYNAANRMNEEDSSEDYQDLADTLQYLAGDYDLNGAEVLFDTSYIYFDLHYGNVRFSDTTASGYIYDGTNTTYKSISHSTTNKYYIFQSQGEARASMTLPTYPRVSYNGMSWGDYITNNTDVIGVLTNWVTAATSVGRKIVTITNQTNTNTTTSNVTVPMYHRIVVNSNAETTTSFDITLDNIWTGFHNDDCKDVNGNIYAGTNINDGSHYRTSGGLSFIPNNKTTTCHLRFKGDNRFGNIHYAVGSGAGGEDGSDQIDEKIKQLFFYNADDINNPATITLGNIGGDNGYNHFCSVIGGANNPSYVPGLVFESGIVYAGATELDNCTAIGGGGCGFGGVTINGGTITAVSATNGAAIGGGIGDGSNGGAANIEITGGEVYAYNMGLAIEGTRESRGQSGTIHGEIVNVTMPSVAIGSGSSRRGYTVPARIKITGGKVYAQSVGGTAIGGGGSNNFDGADAYITISGTADVTAKSVAGTVRLIHEYDQGAFPNYITESGNIGNRNSAKKEYVGASNAIGGGTVGIPFRYNGATLYNQGTGGNAILNISGGTIHAGSIGGGGISDLPDPNGTHPYASLYANVAVGKIGSAQVSISGGTTQGQIVMTKGTEMDCFFEMTGGTIDNGTKDSSFVFLKENGGAVYVENGNATMTGGIIKNCGNAKNGGAFYVSDGSVTIYNGDIINNSVSNNGGAIYVNGGNVSVNSGTIANNIALNKGGAIAVTSGNITIGTEECHDAGESSTHIHPLIEGNIASDGGGIYVDGGATTMWCGDIKHNLTYEKTVNVLVISGGNFVYNGGTIGIPYDSGVFVNGGIFDDNSSESEKVLKHELHYHSILGNEIHNGKIPESKWIASPRGDVLHIEDCDDASPMWSDLFPEYEFVGWESHDDDSEKIVNLYAIWEKK